ncbi:hypothetical protein PoB_001596800 [Plakobranchus ocellatus]|uniref:60S ribosomal protein L28 n=1 Tax=Plakobranchus ocellatus TaxID=259542 RepID=A0AAV3Z3Z1_9GAST|nr:hypothetical protein PoB_001596800 [Plakobranchus ocellatus]
MGEFMLSAVLLSPDTKRLKTHRKRLPLHCRYNGIYAYNRGPVHNKVISSQDAGGGVRTRDRVVLANLRVDSLSTVPSAPQTFRRLQCFGIQRLATTEST